jgi:uncharacterized coiled-coil DUF342 family protein
MLSKFFSLLRKLILSAERDRLEDRFDEISEKFEEFDERIDELKIGQSEIKAEIKASNEIHLANLEAMEQKMNRNTTTAESVRQIVDARLSGFQESMRVVQGLIEQVIKRDCNLP